MKNKTRILNDRGLAEDFLDPHLIVAMKGAVDDGVPRVDDDFEGEVWKVWIVQITTSAGTVRRNCS